MPCPLTSTVTRACTIALVAVIAGGVHSVMVPVMMVPQAPEALDAAGTAVSGGGSVSTKGGNAITNAAAGGGVGSGQGSGGGEDAFAKLDITLEQARGLYQSGVMFVDARAGAEYEAGHIQGALWLPLEAMNGGARPAALDVLDPGAKVVIYCGGGDCHASHDLAIRLNALGFKNCYVLKAGFPAWQSAGYETATGVDPLAGGK